jgi:predicted RNA-binding protein YlqC (UPF0109 family)
MKTPDVREFIEYVARSMVDDPSQVQVTGVEGRNAVFYELRVAPQDVGRVIGKGGRTANAMRALLRAVAARQGRRARLEIAP